jgi:hypothetical protein
MVTATTRVLGRTGFDLHTGYVPVPADARGVRHVRLTELGRLELKVGRVDGGYLGANGTLRDLPPGSFLDGVSGTFTWVPGPGYIGTYRLAFVRRGERIPVAVTIQPEAGAGQEGQSAIRISVDSPRPGAPVSGPFLVEGWALDRRAGFGSGIGAVHVWAQRRDVPSAPALFLGTATLGVTRASSSQTAASAFGDGGFTLAVRALPPGVYDVTVYVWSQRTGRWEDARTVAVAVR